MKQRLKLPILLAGLALLFVVVTAFAFSGHGSKGDESANSYDPNAGKQTDPTDDKPTGPAVDITNAKEFSTWINTDHFAATEEQLYAELKKYITDAKPSYNAVIREGTFKTTYDDTGGVSVPTVTFIVDIADAKQSYVVSQSGGDDYPYDILHISCPDVSQLKYGDFRCVNEEQ